MARRQARSRDVAELAGVSRTTVSFVLNNVPGVKITEDDMRNLEPGSLVRLKDLCNLEMLPDGTFKHLGNDLEILKKGARIIHWVGPDALPIDVRMPDGTTITGLVEKAAENYADKIVQFERFGFVRLEGQGDNLVAFFAHK